MRLTVPPIGEVHLDVAADDDGFSIEATAEESLTPEQTSRLDAAAADLGITTNVVDGFTFRGLASVEDGTLWVAVHATAPGRFDDAAARAAEVALRDIWVALHQASAA